MIKLLVFLLAFLMLSGCSAPKQLTTTPISEPTVSPTPMSVVTKTEYKMIDLLPQQLLDEVNKLIVDYNSRDAKDKYIDLQEIDPITKDSKIQILSPTEVTNGNQGEYNIYLNDKYALNVLLDSDELNVEYKVYGIVLNFYETDKKLYKEERRIIESLKDYLKDYTDLFMGRVFDDVGNEVDDNGEMVPKIHGIKDSVRINSTQDIIDFYRTGIVSEKVDEILKSAYTKNSSTYLIDKDGIPYRFICQCCGENYSTISPFLDEIISVKKEGNNLRVEVMGQKSYTESEKNYFNKVVEVIDLKKESGKWKIVNAYDKDEFNIKSILVTVPIPYYTD